jgi:hypothetical protein
VAYDNNRMDQTRRAAVAFLLASGALTTAQDEPPVALPRRPGQGEDETPRLPDGRSQTDAIAKKQHADSLKDAKQLVTLAGEIRDEIEKAGNFVVPLSTVKKTEEIEKLARKIRGRLKS